MKIRRLEKWINLSGLFRVKWQGRVEGADCCINLWEYGIMKAKEYFRSRFLLKRLVLGRLASLQGTWFVIIHLGLFCFIILAYFN